MCKVAAITGINNKNRDKAWEIMQELGRIMTIGNNDGLGYAAFDKSNRIFGERWVYNEEAFRDPNTTSDYTYKGYGKRRFKEKKLKDKYNFFGDFVKRDEARGIILHTRMATCDVNVINTHPFVDNLDSPETALIHNGVITNHETLTKNYSTCDSEVILTSYLDHKTKNNIQNIQKVADDLFGWYTCFVLTKDKNNNPVMDMFTDNGRLASVNIPSIGVTVYSSELMDLTKMSKILDLKLGDILDYSMGTVQRINFDTGKVLFDSNFFTDEDYFNFGGEVLDMTKISDKDWDNYMSKFFGEEE